MLRGACPRFIKLLYFTLYSDCVGQQIIKVNYSTILIHSEESLTLCEFQEMVTVAPSSYPCVNPSTQVLPSFFTSCSRIFVISMINF